MRKLLFVLAAAATLVLAAQSASAVAAPRSPTVVTLLNNLGDANTSSRLAEQGRNGASIAYDQSVGMLFEVIRPAVLTEVGGFVQSFPSYASEATDVVVEIHPARPNGVPDRTTVIASAPLSEQTDSRFITYQRAAFATLLQPGTYYALFALADQSVPTVSASEALAITGGLRETSPGTFVPYAAPFGIGGVTHPPPYDPSIQELRIPANFAQLIVGVKVPLTRDECRSGGWKNLANERGEALHDAAECFRVASAPGGP